MMIAHHQTSRDVPLNTSNAQTACDVIADRTRNKQTNTTTTKQKTRKMQLRGAQGVNGHLLPAACCLLQQLLPVL